MNFMIKEEIQELSITKELASLPDVMAELKVGYQPNIGYLAMAHK